MDIPFTLHLNNRNANRRRIQEIDVDKKQREIMGARAKALTQNHSNMQARSLPLRDSGATEIDGHTFGSGRFPSPPSLAASFRGPVRTLFSRRVLTAGRWRRTPQG